MLRLFDSYQGLEYLGRLGQGHPLGSHLHPHLLDVCPTGPMDEEPQMPDKDTKAMMNTEDTLRGKASPNPQDLRRSVFYSIKVSLRACQEQGRPDLEEKAV